MKECDLPQWEAAGCQKLGPTFEMIVGKVAEIEFMLKDWMREPNLPHEQWLRITNFMNMLNDIPPMLGDLGFPYYDVMREHQDILKALQDERKAIEELTDEIIREAVFGHEESSTSDRR